MAVGWLETTKGTMFSLAPADTAKIGLLAKCERSVADKTNLIMALLPHRLH